MDKWVTAVDISYHLPLGEGRMFQGEYAHILDSKGRLTIPARFRTELQAGLVMTRGYERCLVIYPLAEWAALASKAARMPTASAAARSYGRLIFGGAFEVLPDKMGRILVPGVLREYASIKDETVIVGVNAYVEVWSPSAWREALEHGTMNLETILADVSKMGV